CRNRVGFAAWDDSITLRAETGATGVTKMEGVVFEFRRLHLDRQVIDAEAVVQLRPQFFQKTWLRNALGMNNVGAQGFASRGNRPNMQVVNIRDAVGLKNGVFDRREVYVCR